MIWFSSLLDCARQHGVTHGGKYPPAFTFVVLFTWIGVGFLFLELSLLLRAWLGWDRWIMESLVGIVDILISKLEAFLFNFSNAL